MNAFFAIHPINTVGYAVGSLALFLVAYKLWRTNRDAPTVFNINYRKTALLLAFAYLAWASPFFFSGSVVEMRVAYVVGNLLFYWSLFYQAIVLWHLGLEGRASERLFLTLVGMMLAVPAFYDVFRTNLPYVQNDLVVWGLGYEDALAQALIILLIIIPIGFFFLSSAIKVRGLARVKPLSLAIVYLGAGFSNIAEDVFQKGLDSYSSSVSNMVVFGLLIIGLLIPLRSKSSPPQAAVEDESVVAA